MTITTNPTQTKTRTRPNVKPDPDRINVNEQEELTAWSDKFDVTKVRLKAAVNAVGPSVKDVAAYLIKKK
jgi:hypothetical protein